MSKTTVDEVRSFVQKSNTKYIGWVEGLDVFLMRYPDKVLYRFRKNGDKWTERYIYGVDRIDVMPSFEEVL